MTFAPGSNDVIDQKFFHRKYLFYKRSKKTDGQRNLKMFCFFAQKCTPLGRNGRVLVKYAWKCVMAVAIRLNPDVFTWTLFSRYFFAKIIFIWANSS